MARNGKSGADGRTPYVRPWSRGATHCGGDETFSVAARGRALGAKSASKNATFSCPVSSGGYD